ncbi:hypothetical protein B1757_05705 [Acidithiobacillus marinus]|uniref:Uncharacterized protein n=2 Tax=Acidithiobacillus marinus TaxID=187490 RepID=A0A2I1DN23_9PROT|nr:hypothetical protein B1757_05705 [Acidithiobacillus marinus]
MLRRLRNSGWSVMEAADGPSALTIIGQQTPSAILLDMGLPGMNGLEVLQQIRKNHTSLTLPVIMVTAFDEKDYLVQALADGANDFVNKPVDFSILKARLKAHLDLSATSQRFINLQARQELILRGAHDGIWELDVQSQQLRHSQRWLDLLQCHNNLKNMSIAQWIDRIHPQDQQHVEQFIHDFIANPTSDTLSLDYRIRREDGHYLWIHTRGAADSNPQGQLTYIAGTHTDISKDRYQHRVTGLANIEYLSDYWLSIQSLIPEHSISLLAILLDHNASTPDNRNHYRAFMTELGQFIHNKTPSVVQLGTGKDPNQLLIFIDKSDSDNQLPAAIEELICTLVDEIIHKYKNILTINYHCGFLNSGERLADFEDSCAAVFAAAEHAHQHRKHIQIFDKEMQNTFNKRKTIIQKMSGAITHKHIQPWLQPIIMNGTTLVGFEALARWEDADLGRIHPVDFLPLAEESGQLSMLTKTILDQALHILSTLIKQGTIHEQIYVSVNFEAEQLVDPQFENLLESTIDHHDLHPRHLSIELIESNWLDVNSALRERLEKLRTQGYKLVLDDFGTGYSSLSMLNQLPFSTLKIDQSFVRRMLSEHSTCALVKSIIAIGKALNLSIIAEGVETLEEEQFLLQSGVNITQGFFRGRPMAMDVLLKWLEDHPQGSIKEQALHR